MEAGRTRWTDERIDDLAFEIRSLRQEMRDGFRELRSESGLNRRLLMSMWLTMMLGFAGLIVEAGLR
jgi:hypothetical protein